MQVSIIVPTYNRPERLARALASVIAQTHTAWEALVVDDGDGRGAAYAASLAEKIGERTGEARIRAFSNVGRGQVAARNTALAHARGEVIALLDDDDLWDDREHLARAVAALGAAPALVHSPCFMVYERDGVETHRELFNLPTSASSLRTDNTVIASSVAYPRAFHAELGPFDPEVGSYWDWDWLLRVSGAGHPLVTLSTPGVFYTIHAGGASATLASPSRLQNFETFRRKHGLEVVIKNHASLLAATLEALPSDT